MFNLSIIWFGRKYEMEVFGREEQFIQIAKLAR